MILAAALLVSLRAADGTAQPVHAAADYFVTPGGTGSGAQDDPADLAGALALAGDGDTIYLAAGTYTSSDQAVVILGAATNLLGGWDGAPSGPIVRDPSVHISILDGEGARQGLAVANLVSLSIDGLTITNGLADDGGGIYVEDASLVIQNCVISGNQTQTHGSINGGRGGGIFIDGASAVQVLNNQIINNQSGWGGAVFRHGSLISIFRGNFVSGNTSSNDGSGIFLSSADLDQIIGNEIMNNTAALLGGGLRLWASDALVIGNLIHGNEAVRCAGITLANGSRATIVNNILYDNDKDGIFVDSSRPIVIHNTLVGSNSTDAGYGIAFYNEDLCAGDYCAGGDFLNNIVTAFQVGFGSANNAPVDYTIDYNNVWGNLVSNYDITVTPGAHNLSQDPLFHDPAGMDYHLQPASPCINAGTASFPAAAPVTDFDGDSRPILGAYDIGADEVHQFCLPLIIR
jgi:parallel beta-helix repeat protein